MTTSFYEIFEKSRTNPSIYKNIETSYDLQVLRNTLKTIISQDPSQIKNYINNLNSFIFSKKFEVVPRSNFIYNRPFNHNGQFLYFPEERMMFTIDNYSKDKSDDLYEMKVFKNGELLTPEKHYSVITNLGSKRIFIKSSEIREFDVIHVLAARKYNFFQSSFHAITVPTSNYGGDFEYTADVYNTGKIFDNPDFLCLSIKKFNDPDGNFKVLTRNTEYQISRISATQVQVKVMVNVSKDDQLLLVNKLANYKMIFDSTNHSDDAEYMAENSGLLNIPLKFWDNVLEDYIPFPIENINEIDVFGAGGKLIPNEDYTLVLKDEVIGIPVIKINGFIKKDSRIHIENRLWDVVYNVGRVNSFIGNSQGYIPVLDANIPMDSRYIEVYLGRRKVAEDDISVIADCILKVDRQRCLNKVDIRSSLLISEDFKYFDEDFKNGKSDLIEVVENMGVQNFLSTYTANNNPTTNLTDVDPLDPFLPGGKIVSIRLELDHTSYTQGIDEPQVRVFAVMENGTEIDITEFCILEFTDMSDLRDPEAVGTVNVTYQLTATQTLTGSATYVVEEKEIYGILIELDSAVVEQNESISYQVYCMYADDTKRNITNRPNLVVTVPPTNTTGNKVVSAEYTVGSEVFQDTKNFSVVLYKEVDHLEIIPEKLYILNGEEVDINVIAFFKDGTTENISEEAVITGYIPGTEGFQTLVATFNHGSSYTASSIVEFKYKVGPLDAVIEDSERSLTLNLQGVVPFDYKYFKVFKTVVGGWEAVTAGVTSLTERAMLLTTIAPEDELKIEIYGEGEVLLDSIYNNDIKVNFIERVPNEAITLTRSIDVDGNLIVNFNIDITNSLISLNSLYQKYITLNSTTIKYNHDTCVFNNSNVDLNTIMVYNWDLLNKTALGVPSVKIGNYFQLGYEMDPNSIVIINGKMYGFIINPTDPTQIEIPGSIVSDLSTVEIYKFEHNNNIRIKKYELVGVNDVSTTSSLFNYDIRHAVVNYNGLNYKYTLGNVAPLIRNKVQYNVPTDLAVFDNLEVRAIAFGYNEQSNYINVGVIS